MLLAAEDKDFVEVLFCNENTIGDKVNLEGSQNKPKAEVTFDDFKKIKIVVKDFKLFAEGKQLFARDKGIKTTKIKDGVVR
jgi:hypothetical protein